MCVCVWGGGGQQVTYSTSEDVMSQTASIFSSTLTALPDPGPDTVTRKGCGCVCVCGGGGWGVTGHHDNDDMYMTFATHVFNT